MLSDKPWPSAISFSAASSAEYALVKSEIVCDSSANSAIYGAEVTRCSISLNSSSTVMEPSSATILYARTRSWLDILFKISSYSPSRPPIASRTALSCSSTISVSRDNRRYFILSSSKPRDSNSASIASTLDLNSPTSRSSASKVPLISNNSSSAP